jgi:ABC-type Fe3+ transport system permease subunit
VLVFVLAMRDLDSAILVPAANRTAIFRVFNGVHFGRDSYVAALSLLLVFAIVLPGLLWTVLSRKGPRLLP